MVTATLSSLQTYGRAKRCAVTSVGGWGICSSHLFGTSLPFTNGILYGAHWVWPDLFLFSSRCCLSLLWKTFWNANGPKCAYAPWTPRENPASAQRCNKNFLKMEPFCDVNLGRIHVPEQWWHFIDDYKAEVCKRLQLCLGYRNVLDGMWKNTGVCIERWCQGKKTERERGRSFGLWVQVAGTV